MNSSTSEIANYRTDYSIIGPASMIFAVIAIIITSIILIIVLLTKQFHTVTRLLTCNTCLASLLYCIVQCVNYSYLLVITWDKSDQSCRWRGYFGYMSMIAFLYSYVLQVISRLFFIILYTKYRWLITLRTHLYLIVIGWIIILVVPSPAILTHDIFFREGELCWVTKTYKLHTYYIIVAYYVIPIVLIIVINLFIYIPVYYSGKNTTIQRSIKRNDRDFIIFRNIMISFSVYFLGGVPIIIYMFTDIEFFYSVGVISVTFAVIMEKLVLIYLDREIRNMLKHFFCQKRTQVMPLIINAAFIVH
ncbi:unnamed protein product [Adineta steineri]|uniref:G-protein coupled receptors family 1 profile domain-containing protein n=1 Tax=Adineta steineri TaxID=433720 RepID=A0A819MRD5_9BILA|nr:unnamed protein product [Adineta steineri]CAF1139087.1 unnamed protein product [Adineta steineri]CAF1211465.1 unnamed protein product [Adineta steineri]CAF3660032.1 unnamed protein product [Adineta steineri]CAF3826596.1 unnamed protein product [Adineta steineri]